MSTTIFGLFEVNFFLIFDIVFDGIFWPCWCWITIKTPKRDQKKCFYTKMADFGHENDHWNFRTLWPFFCKKSIAWLQFGLARPIFGQTLDLPIKICRIWYRIDWLPTITAIIPLEGHKTSLKTAYYDKFEIEIQNT